MPAKTKLTASQWASLESSARSCGMHVYDHYPPIRKLFELDLVTRTAQGMSNPIYRANEAGRALLAAEAAKNSIPDTTSSTPVLGHMAAEFRMWRDLNVLIDRTARTVVDLRSAISGHDKLSAGLAAGIVARNAAEMHDILSLLSGPRPGTDPSTGKE